MIKAKIIGAGGYGGVGIAELLLRHPQAEVTTLVDVDDVGVPISSLYPHLRGFLDQLVLDPDDSRVQAPVDVAFIEECLLRLSQLVGDFEASAVTGTQQIWLSGFPTVPDRPDGVDHPTRRQLESGGGLGIPRLAPTQRNTRLQQRRPSRTMNRSIDTSAAQIKRRIGVQLQSTSLLPDLTVIEQITLFARLYGCRMTRADGLALVNAAAADRFQCVLQIVAVICQIVRQPIEQVGAKRRLVHVVDRFDNATAHLLSP